METNNNTGDAAAFQKLLSELDIKPCFRQLIIDLCSGDKDYRHFIEAQDLLGQLDANGKEIPMPVARGLVRKLRSGNSFSNEAEQHRGMSTEELNEIIKASNNRCDSLEQEKGDIIPPVSEEKRADLGKYFKFVNRETSINNLIKHAAKQYDLYAQDGGAPAEQVQWAACSGGPGLGKTTFCRKAFTRAIDSLKKGDNSGDLWKDVTNDQEFTEVVRQCVDSGRQYRINFGEALEHRDHQDPSKSFSYRLLKCLVKGKDQKRKISFADAPSLQDVLLGLTQRAKKSLIVVNFDETNKIFELGGIGRAYLVNILTTIRRFNRKQQGFVFCIMSGTNVRDLHDTLKAASDGLAPLEIQLPLLGENHMVEILEDLANRANNVTQSNLSNSAKASSDQSNLTVGEELKYVLTVLGGVPRYVEVLAHCLGRDENRCFQPSKYVEGIKSPPRPPKLLANVRTIILVQYGLVFEGIMTSINDSFWQALVSASLFQWEISRDARVGSLDYTIGALETRGILFVTTTDDTITKRKKSIIVFPLLFMTYILDNSTKDIPMLLQDFDVLLSSDENEKNTLTIFLLKCQGLRTLGKDITIEALLPGHAPNLKWRRTPLHFDINRMQMITTENQITSETWNAFETEHIKKKGVHGFFVNAATASFADALVVSKAPNTALLIQEKQGQGAKQQALKNKTVKKFGYDLVKTDHGKCNIGTPHVFVILSDEDFKPGDSRKIKDNEIVLSRKEHKNALGPLLALLRLHNHAYQPKITLKRKART